MKNKIKWNIDFHKLYSTYDMISPETTTLICREKKMMKKDKPHGKVTMNHHENLPFLNTCE